MEEYLETSYDKFVFRVKVGYFYSKDDFWASITGNIATVGVSDFLQKARGDVAFLETADVGIAVNQGQELGKIETIKATFAILSPVSGKVVDVNSALDSSAYLINEDPYGAGWIHKIELADFAGDKANLLQAGGYLELMEQKIAEEMKKK
jgi:glycine cleavage system H protein